MTKEEVLTKLKFDVELRGLSQYTQDEYYTKVKIFQNHSDKTATELGIEDLRNFLHYLSIEKTLTSGSINTYNSGLRFLYGVTLNINLNIKKFRAIADNSNFQRFLPKRKSKSFLTSATT